MSLNPEDLIDSVNSKESFLEFMRALRLDREDENRKEAKSPSSPYGPGANGWENSTIEAFLEAMHAWADSGLPEKPTWKDLARLLQAGKAYE